MEIAQQHDLIIDEVKLVAPENTAFIPTDSP